MKVRLGIICLLALGLCACGASSSFRSRKKVTQGIDYSHYDKNDSYYEFTSALPPEAEGVLLPAPSVMGADSEEQLGEDEDFVSENLTSSYNTYGDVVVTVSSRKFALGTTATRKDMAVFMKSIETAYSRALRTYQPSGFTYSMSSVGAVNPLSDVQVQCRMSERSANDNGQKACHLFFDTIRTTYLKLKEVKS